MPGLNPESGQEFVTFHCADWAGKEYYVTTELSMMQQHSSSVAY